MIEEIPYSEQSEKWTLSAFTKDSTLLAAHPLDPEAFHLPAHRTIYRRMLATGETDAVILGEAMAIHGEVDSIPALAGLLTYAVGPHFDHHLAVVHECHHRRKAIELAREIVEASNDRSDPNRYQATLAKAGEVLKAAAAPGKQSLLERAYALRFDPDSEPPPDEVCLVIGDVPIASRGNLTGNQGKSKVGKSSVNAGIIGAAHRGNYSTPGDTFCIEWKGEAKGAIIHLDTEQSRADWHALVRRAITRSGIPDMSDRLVSLPLVMFARSERLEILRQTLRHERDRLGSIDLVVIDGVADLCASPNDEAESLELISRLQALAQEFNCAIVCVLHENPGTDNAKTRGHLGSELNRKAFANLRIDKDSETSVSTIYGTDMRKRDLPKEHGFCFAWDDTAGMHTFQGRAEGVKAAQKEAEAVSRAREEWTPIYEFAAENGTNGPCPELNPEAAAIIERDINGTSKLTASATMKKRMQRAETLGVLRKTARGEWTLNQTGQTGHERDKR